METTGARAGAVEPDFGQYMYPPIGRPAPHIGHMNHLCDMVEKGHVPLSRIKELVADPKFICKKCGRVAAKSENLCEPTSL